MVVENFSITEDGKVRASIAGIIEGVSLCLLFLHPSFVHSCFPSPSNNILISDLLIIKMFANSVASSCESGPLKYFSTRCRGISPIYSRYIKTTQGISQGKNFSKKRMQEDTFFHTPFGTISGALFGAISGLAGKILI